MTIQGITDALIDVALADKIKGHAAYQKGVKDYKGNKMPWENPYCPNSPSADYWKQGYDAAFRAEFS